MVGAKGATTTKFLKFSLPIWISAFGGFEWGARKRLRKNKGENFRDFVPSVSEAPLGSYGLAVELDVHVWIFLEKSSYFIQEGQVWK